MRNSAGGCGCVLVMMSIGAAVGIAVTGSPWGLVAGPALALTVVAAALWWFDREDP